MRFKNFSFIEENFGDLIQCVVIWDENEFLIITVIEEKIRITRYKDIKDLIKEFITNKEELDFLSNLVVEQEKDIDELEEKLKDE